MPSFSISSPNRPTLRSSNSCVSIRVTTVLAPHLRMTDRSSSRSRFHLYKSFLPGQVVNPKQPSPLSNEISAICKGEEEESFKIGYKLMAAPNLVFCCPVPFHHPTDRRPVDRPLPRYSQRRRPCSRAGPACPSASSDRRRPVCHRRVRSVCEVGPESGEIRLARRRA